MPPEAFSWSKYNITALQDRNAVLCVVTGGVADERNVDLAVGRGCIGSVSGFIGSGLGGAVDSLACVVLEPCSVLAAQPAITLSSMTTASAKQNNFFMFFIISYLICEIFFSCTRQHEISFLSQRRAVVKTIAALQKAKPLTL